VAHSGGGRTACVPLWGGCVVLHRMAKVIVLWAALSPGCAFAQTKGRYGRWISVCYVHDLDLNAWMVRHGWALAYRRYADDYAPQEKTAKAQKQGLWPGAFVPPWVWRRKQNAPSARFKPHSHLPTPLKRRKIVGRRERS